MQLIKMKFSNLLSLVMAFSARFNSFPVSRQRTQQLPTPTPSPLKIMPDDPRVYLADDFDPSKLTLPALLRILSSHDIALPGTKNNKAFYVNLFKEKLLPQRAKILRELDQQVSATRPPSFIDHTQQNVKKKSAKMADVVVKEQKRRKTRDPSPDLMEDVSFFSDDNPFQSGAESAGGSAKKRKLEDEDVGTPAKKKNRWKGVKEALVDDFGFPEEDLPKKTPRSKTPIHEKTPLMESTPGLIRSTSSPHLVSSLPIRPVESPDQVTQTPLKFISPAQSQPVSVGTSPYIQPVRVPSRPPSRIREPIKEPVREPIREPIREPVREVKLKKDLVVAKPKPIVKPKVSKPRGPIISPNFVPNLINISLQLLTLGMFASLAFYSHDWHQNHLRGFHSEHVPAPDKGVTMWNPLAQVLPSTLPCPPNSICEPDGIVECAADYSMEPSWIHRILPPHLLPFPLNQPKCNYDASKVELERKREAAVKWISGRTTEVARDWAGKVDCREVLPSKPVARGLPEAKAKATIKKELSKKKSPPTDLEFDIYWHDLVQQVQQGFVANLTMQDGLLITSLEPVYSFSCKVRNQVYGIARYLVLGFLLWLGQLYLRWQWRRRQNEDELVHELFDQVLKLLRSRRIEDGGISKDQLRDTLMSHSAPRSTKLNAKGYARLTDGRIWLSNNVKDMNRVWNQVADLVRRNANVREIDIPVHGELHTGWEWTGLRQARLDQAEASGKVASAEPSPVYQRRVASELGRRPIV